MSPALTVAELTDEIMSHTGLFDFLWRQLSRSLLHIQPWLPLTQSASPYSFSHALTRRQHLCRLFRVHLFPVICQKWKSRELRAAKLNCCLWLPSHSHTVWAGFHFLSYPFSCYCSRPIIHMKSCASKEKVNSALQFVVHADHATIRHLACMNILCTTIWHNRTYRHCCQVKIDWLEAVILDELHCTMAAS